MCDLRYLQYAFFTHRPRHARRCDVGALKAPCVIYSMGSAGDFSFERSMLASSKCDVFTFDCSFDGKSIDPRHTYKKWCLGKRASAGFR